MATKTWRLQVAGNEHTVELKQRILGGTVEVLVDGETVHEPNVQGEAMVGGDFAFEIDGHAGCVHLRPGMLKDHLDLTLDGVSQPNHYLRCRIFIVGKRRYTVLGEVPFDAPEKRADVAKFLDAFRVLSAK